MVEFLSTTDDAMNCKAVFIHNESKSTEVEASLSADDKWLITSLHVAPNILKYL